MKKRIQKFSLLIKVSLSNTLSTCLRLTAPGCPQFFYPSGNICESNLPKGVEITYLSQKLITLSVIWRFMRNKDTLQHRLYPQLFPRFHLYSDQVLESRGFISHTAPKCLLICRFTRALFSNCLPVQTEHNLMWFSVLKSTRLCI